MHLKRHRTIERGSGQRILCRFKAPEMGKFSHIFPLLQGMNREKRAAGMIECKETLPP